MEIENNNQHVIDLWNEGKRNEAIALGQDAASLAKKTHGSKHPAFALSLKNLGRLYVAECDYEQAETFFVKAFDIEREALGLYDKNTFDTMSELGDLYSVLEAYGQAEEYYLLALEALKQNSKLDRILIPKLLYKLGLAQFYRGIYEDALESFDEAMKFLKKQSSPDPELWGSILFIKGAVLINQKQLDSGIAVLEQAYSHDKETLDEVHPNLARDLLKLADAYRLQGTSETAKKYLQDYIELIQQTCGEDQPELVIGLHHLAQVLLDLQEIKEAEGVIRRAVKIARKVYEKNSREEAALLGAMADILLKEGRTADAGKYLQQSQKIMAIHSPSR